MKTKIKKLLSIFIAVCLILNTSAAFAKEATKPDISAKAYALIELNTGRLLLSKNEDMKLPMASTTKIMTCILAIEKLPLDTKIKISKNAEGTEGSSMYLRCGEVLTLEELLYGLMVVSGNDAAVAVAEAVGGNVEDFICMMNEKASELGLTNTHFVTPNGLHDDEHYTSAKDLCALSCYAMKNETFAKIVSTKSKIIEADEDNSVHYLNSKNKILKEYDGGCGIKTGYTKKAGRCLSASAKKDEMTLVAVVLSAPDMFEDAKKLLDYGFDNFRLYEIVKEKESIAEIPVKNGISKSIKVESSESCILPLREDEYKIIRKTVNLPEFLTAPINCGDSIGSISIYNGDELLKEIMLYANESILENDFSYNLGRILKSFLHCS